MSRSILIVVLGFMCHKNTEQERFCRIYAEKFLGLGKAELNEMHRGYEIRAVDFFAREEVDHCIG